VLSLVVVIFGFASTSKVIGQEDEFLRWWSDWPGSSYPKWSVMCPVGR